MHWLTTRRRIAGYSFFGYLEFGAAIYTPLLLHWAGFSLTTILLLDSVLLLASLAGDLPGGYLADRYGRRMVLVLSNLVFAAGIIFFIATPNVWLIAIGSILLGLGTGAGSSVDEVAMIEASEGEDTLGGLSLLAILRQVGRVLAAVLGGWLAVQFGERVAIAMFVPALLVAVGLVWGLPDTRPDSIKKPEPFLKTIRLVLAEVWPNARIRRTILNYLAVAVPVWVMWALQAPILESHGMSVAGLGVVYAAFMLAPVPGIKLLKLACTVMGERTVLALSGAGVAVSIMAIAASDSLAVVIGAFVACGFFGFSRGPLLFDAIYAELPDWARGTAASIISSTLSIVAAIAYPVAGYLYGKVPATALILFGILAAVGTFLVRQSTAPRDTDTDLVTAT